MRPVTTLAVLAALALAGPAAAQPKKAGPKPTLDNNLKQVGLALHGFHDSMGHFPPPAITSKDGKPLLSWRVAILPYVEELELYKKFKMEEAWDSPHNKKVLADNPLPPVYAIPAAAKPAEKDAKKTHFLAFTGNGALFEANKKLRINEVVDGTSNTVMVALAKAPVEWTKPDDLAFDPKADPRKLLLRVARNGKPNEQAGYRVLFADGSVRSVAADVDEAAFKALVTRGAGDVAEEKKK